MAFITETSNVGTFASVLLKCVFVQAWSLRVGSFYELFNYILEALAILFGYGRNDHFVSKEAPFASCSVREIKLTLLVTIASRPAFACV